MNSLRSYEFRWITFGWIEFQCLSVAWTYSCARIEAFTVHYLEPRVLIGSLSSFYEFLNEFCTLKLLSIRCKFPLRMLLTHPQWYETNISSVSLNLYIWVIDQGRGQDGWILAKSFYCVLWTERKSRSINWTRPISSHLDRTNLVNKGFIILVFGGIFSCGKWRVVPSGQDARSGSQSHPAI